MSVETTVLVDGIWVTRTVPLRTIIQEASSKTKPRGQRLLTPPQAAVLTRTILESPLVHWILPVQLRSPSHNDVAFIGDHFVHIRELDPERQLRDVIRKNDFGSRIRNARVIGSPDPNLGDPSIKAEESDVEMVGGAPLGLPRAYTQLPTQMLLLALETGESVFLFLRHRHGRPEFVTTSFECPRNSLVYPGFHLAVDPSSRYMASACPEGGFIIHELETVSNLNESYNHQRPLKPVKSYRPRTVQGVIHKMEFLFPRPEDDYHVILMLIVVKRQTSKLVTYEWEVGDDLKMVFSEEKPGHRLPKQYQMPLLLIPLRVRTAFFIISEKGIAVCRDVLSGPPDFDDFTNITDEPPTELYHGLGDPLWTEWTRPPRLHRDGRDSIYLAREDGVIVFLEINRDNILDTSVNVGKVDCNVSKAFASLEDPYFDYLIVGGDSGPGAVLQVKARERPISVCNLPNWSPVVDFITTDEFATWNQQVGSNGNWMVPWQEQPFHKAIQQDRLFGTSGRGITGSVTEFRHGIRANIGLDVAYDIAMTQSWMLPDSLSDPRGYHILTTTPDRTGLLHFPDDFSEASEVAAEATPYDLSSRTLAAAKTGIDTIVQVTERSIVVHVTSNTEPLRYPLNSICQDSAFTISDAVIEGETIVISAHTNALFQIHIFNINAQAISLVKSIDAKGDVTCLCVSSINNATYVLAGLWNESGPQIALYAAEGPANEALHTSAIAYDLDDQKASSTSTIEALTSISTLPGPHTNQAAIILMGTRSGEFITLAFENLGAASFSGSIEKIGLAGILVQRMWPCSDDSAVLVCVDQHLILMSHFDFRRKRGFRKTHRVWITDVKEPTALSPPITSVTVLDSGVERMISENHDYKTLLVLSGERILLMELVHGPGPVSRPLPVGGTPLKMIYSHHLGCLIVAVVAGDSGCTLKFLDPDSGEDLSRPTRKDNVDQDFVSGLGKPDDRIYGLSEWIYREDTRTWVFVLVSTQKGRLIVISAEREMSGRVRFWTRYKRSRYDAPIYSVVGDGDAIFFCVDTVLHWEVLDFREKKLQEKKTFQLRSPAISLRVVDGKIVATTIKHSIEIIDRGAANGDMSIAHLDPQARGLLHSIEAGVRHVVGDGEAEDTGAAEEAYRAITLLADREAGLTGLWVPWQRPGKECEVVFHAELPASIKTLRRGRVRAPWAGGHGDRRRYGHVPATVDGAEIVGSCLDGSLQHVALLGMDAWRVLRLVQNLALASPALCPFTYEEPGRDWSPAPVVESKLSLHIDGDMLQRALDQRALEALLADPAHLALFKTLLDGLDGGRWTRGIPPQSAEGYFDVAYDMLEFYLAPVL